MFSEELESNDALAPDAVCSCFKTICEQNCYKTVQRFLDALDYLVSNIMELQGRETTSAIMSVITPSAQWLLGLASTETSTSAKAF